jgi:D-alanyl-D-alanine endopeptidase (penicillin-binding protein 7)
VPASLVKLATVLVVLDTQPDWNKACTVGQGERVGGVEITKANQTVVYTMQSLLYATLIPSANDAATALAHCSGLGHQEFLDRMNAKAREQGAVNTTYVDFSGISAANVTTATDMAKIANAAFSTERIRTITRLASYRLCSVDKQCQSLRNTNQLLKDKDLITVAGKTGTLDGAINFAGSFKDSHGHYFIVVVLGGSSKDSRFAEAKQLVKFASVRADWSDQFSIK